jgi:hypothetical protein
MRLCLVIPYHLNNLKDRQKVIGDEVIDPFTLLYIKLIGAYEVPSIPPKRVDTHANIARSMVSWID